MNPRRLRSLWRGLFRRRQQEHELQQEIDFHLEMLIRENMASGMTAEEARQAAQREFGGADQYRESCRDSWRPEGVDRLLADLRFAFQSLRRSPGFTWVAVATLALGIGANTAMFSMLKTVMLEPPPYPDSEHLEHLYRHTNQNPKGQVSVADYLDLVQSTGPYGEVAATAYADVSLAEPGHPADIARALRVSASFFSLLGVPPQLGRSFRPEEAVEGNHQFVVISHRAWENRFGRAADIVGRVVRLDGKPHEVVGVLPASFNDWRHLGWVDVFVPLTFTESEKTDRSSLPLSLYGRRSTSVSASDAAAYIAAFGARLAARHPDLHTGATWRTVPLRDVLIGDTGSFVLSMLVGLSGFVVLIACSNLANFLLARTMARAREFAVRGALGASRLQLLRPLLAEALILAVGGGLCAMVVAQGFSDWLRIRSTDDNGDSVHLVMDWTVFAWALGAAVATALAFGLAPALYAVRLDLNGTLKSGGRGTTGSRGHSLLRHGLIVAQFGLALILLTGGALFMHGLNDLNNRRAGWESDDLVTGTLLLPEATYPDADHIVAFQRLALERLAALPGVESASLSTFMPFFHWNDTRKYLIEGRERPEPGREPAALFNAVSPGYFPTVGTRLIAGREFTEADTVTSAPVAILSESTARGLFGDEDPLGRRLTAVGGTQETWWEVVGVAADVKSVFPDPTPVTFQIYRPIHQEPSSRQELAIRTRGIAPAMLLADVRSVISSLDPDLPVRQLNTADARIRRANYQLGILGEMLTVFAVLGLALAAMGVYGVIARSMAARSAEFGIRLALGAHVRDVARLVLGFGIRLALAGSAAGLVGAYGLASLLRATFPNMDMRTTPVLVLAIATLVAVALAACYLPARRAGRIDPIAALRAD